MRKYISWATLALFAVVLSFWPAAAANAVVVTIQPGPTDGKDAEVRHRDQGDWDDLNFGERAYIQARADSHENRRYYSFVQFDVSSLVPADVVSVKFSACSSAYFLYGNSSVNREISLYKVTEDWIEGIGNTNPIPDDITYNNQPSFDPPESPLATITVKATITQAEEDAGGVWHIWDSEDTGNAGLADLVKEWVAGTTPNYGLVIRFTEPDNTAGRASHIYHSSDYIDDPLLRPMLEISDTGGTPDPIPGDANNDDVVNDQDASILAAHWQQTGMGWGDGDFNGDGDVNDADASILAAHWQESQEGSAAPVPEPSTVVLLAFAAISLLLIRRRW